MMPTLSSLVFYALLAGPTLKAFAFQFQASDTPCTPGESCTCEQIECTEHHAYNTS